MYKEPSNTPNNDNTTVAYVMFKNNRDNLEFLGLLDVAQFNGKLRVVPIGFTDVDQNRRFESFTSQKQKDSPFVTTSYFEFE